MFYSNKANICVLDLVLILRQQLGCLDTVWQIAASLVTQRAKIKSASDSHTPVPHLSLSLSFSPSVSFSLSHFLSHSPFFFQTVIALHEENFACKENPPILFQLNHPFNSSIRANQYWRSWGWLLKDVRRPFSLVVLYLGWKDPKRLRNRPRGSL